MTEIELERVAAEAEAVSYPAAPVQSEPALSYNIEFYTNHGTGSPLNVVIGPDASREMIGFYLGAGDPVRLIPVLGLDDGSGILLLPTGPILELRYSSHGPMARDGWTLISDINDCSITVAIITREGGV